MERERKRKQAKEREKNEGRLARAPLSERLEQAKFNFVNSINRHDDKMSLA